MSNRKDLLKKSYDRYHNEGGKEKAAEYYQKNKEMIKVYRFKHDEKGRAH